MPRPATEPQNPLSSAEARERAGSFRVFRFRMRDFPGQHLTPRFVIFPGATDMPEESEKVLTFEIVRDGDTAVVKCHGRLVAGATEEFNEEVKKRLRRQQSVG